jgi:acyl carrier protein
VLSELAPRRGVTELSRDDDLLRTGIIDSLGVTELIAFLEERYRIDVRPEDVVPENFRTLGSIIAFAERQR